MKTFWKTMGIAALAALVPVNFRKDEETGKKTYQSLLLSVDVGPGKDDVHTDIGINIGEGLLTDLGRRLIGSRREADMFTDDPAEATVGAELAQELADAAQAAADDAQIAADEAQAIADDLRVAADEAQQAADVALAAEFDAEDAGEPEATEDDFDPEE